MNAKINNLGKEETKKETQTTNTKGTTKAFRRLAWVLIRTALAQAKPRQPTTNKMAVSRRPKSPWNTAFVRNPEKQKQNENGKHQQK